MRSFRLIVVGLFLAAVSSILPASGLFADGGASGRTVSVSNFACAGVGKYGICVGPPTTNSTRPI